MLWRSLLIRVLVNFAAIFLTVLLMPGFNVINPWLGSWVLDLLAAALILALLNAFVKPVLQILTGPFDHCDTGPVWLHHRRDCVVDLLIWISRSHWEAVLWL